VQVRRARRRVRSGAISLPRCDAINESSNFRFKSWPVIDLADAEILYQLALVTAAMALVTVVSAYLFTLGSGERTDVARPGLPLRTTK
jgi:hypothetical protein